MDIALESVPSIRRNIGKHIENVLSFPPIKVSLNLARVALFPVYFGIAIIVNGTRDESEAPPSALQRLVEIGTGAGVLAMDAGVTYGLMKTYYLI